MKPWSTRRLTSAVVAVVAAIVALVCSLPASAQLRTFLVKLPTGSVVTVTVDAAPGVPMNQVPGLPGTPIQEITGSGPGGDQGGSGSTTSQQPPPPAQTQPQAPATTTQTTPQAHLQPAPPKPTARKGKPQHRTRSSQPAPKAQANPQAKPKARPHAPAAAPGGTSAPTTGARPNFFDTLPGPTSSQKVPDFIINNFRVPIFMLPVYQAAGIQYGVRWEVLAAINEIETNYGRDLSVSSAGAVGWMQFLPSTWRAWGVDGNHDGKMDPMNPVDAVFGAARYLRAAGADKDIRKAIFAYNHADWYVQSVLLRAQELAQYPADFVGALTGLTGGRPPVPEGIYPQAPATPAPTQPRLTQNATAVDQGAPHQRGIDIDARAGAAVIAANDGIVRDMGHSKRDGRFLVLQDVYGNIYTYKHLGSLAVAYPQPKTDAKPPSARQVRAALAARSKADPTPTAPATAGVQGQPDTGQKPPSGKLRVAPTTGASAQPPAPAAPLAQQPAAFKARAFAHPSRPASRAHGGLDQLLTQQLGGASGQAAFDTYLSGVVGLNSKNAVLKPLRRGANLIAGTIIGHVGAAPKGQRPHIHFEIQPAGKNAPKIDPQPVLNGWRLLATTHIYSTDGKNVLYQGSKDTYSIGQVLLLPKPLLERRVLSDARIQIYPCGRQDIKTGQIDSRPLATLEYLADSGLYPTVTALKCGHSEFTSAGNISEHASGNAVDIAAINGTPIEGHQGPGSITEQTLRALMLLQGTMQPHQLISLMSLGGNTLALPDHHDHIHIGFHPLFGDNTQLGRTATSILAPKQWDKLIAHLSTLSNPSVSATASKYAIPDVTKPLGK